MNVFCPLCVFLHRNSSSKREWYRQPLFLLSFRLDLLKMKRGLSELLGARPLLEEGVPLDKAEVNRQLLKLIRQVASGPQF